MRITGQDNNIIIMKELGSRLKSIRISQGLTQAELAACSGVALKTVARAEQGENIAFDKVLNLLRALKLVQNAGLLLPEQEFRPVEYFEKKPLRVRVRKSQRKTVRKWVWGDEK